MIVDDITGLVWRWIMGAILNAVERGDLDRDDPRITEILDWMAGP